MQKKLTPFAPCDVIESMIVTVDNVEGCTRLEFQIDGTMDSIIWPFREASGERTMGLWKHTCFECFVGRVSSHEYIEINVSPSGDWNVFTFDDVRQGMRETENVSVQAAMTRTGASARLVAELMLPWSGRMRIGVSAVIEETNNRRHYFALVHQGPKPDFHRRDNHLLEMELG